MAETTYFQITLAVWILIFGSLFKIVRGRVRLSVALPIAFFFAMTFEYIGAFAYAVPGYDHLRPDGDPWLASKEIDVAHIKSGITLTTLALASFVIGVWAFGLGRRINKRAPERRPKIGNRVFYALGGLTLGGLFTMFVDLPIPMYDAFSQVSRNAAVVFICLGAFVALSKQSKTSFAMWGGAAALVPALYLFAWGFMSYGFLAITFFAAFYAMKLTNKPPGTIPGTAVGALATYGLISIFVSYMSFRGLIRSVVWGGGSISDRFNVVLYAMRDITVLNPFDYASLDWLMMRLNQGMFVGKVIESHAVNETLRVHGETLILALIAWIPRPLWPGKPELGGSNFLQHHSGIDFSDKVSFGAGQVIELYVNFGTPAVIVGFIVLGWVIALFDQRAGESLSAGNYIRFAKYATLGLALIKPLSDVFFLVNTVAATLIVFWVLETFVVGQNRRVPSSTAHLSRAQSGHAHRDAKSARFLRGAHPFGQNIGNELSDKDNN